MNIKQSFNILFFINLLIGNYSKENNPLETMEESQIINDHTMIKTIDDKSIEKENNPQIKNISLSQDNSGLTKIIKKIYFIDGCINIWAKILFIMTISFFSIFSIGNLLCYFFKDFLKLYNEFLYDKIGFFMLIGMIIYSMLNLIVFYIIKIKEMQRWVKSLGFFIYYFILSVLPLVYYFISGLILDE